MAHILCNWIVKEVGIPRQIEPENLEDALKSGHLFAVIFNRYQLLKDLNGIIDNPSAEVALKNFFLLEPVFRQIGVPLTSNIAYDIITGKSGSASKVLYQIKMALTDEFAVKKAQSLYENMPKKRQAFLEKEHDFFVERLRSKFHIPKLKDLAVTIPTTSVFIGESSIDAVRKDVTRIKSESQMLQEALTKSIREYDTSQEQLNTSTSAHSSSSRKYVEKVQYRQREEREIKKEHDTRRDIILKERKKLQEELSRSNCHKHVVDYIGKRSWEEQAFKQHVEDVLREKEVILHNQLWAQREAEQRREKEENALVRLNSNMKDFFNMQSQTWLKYMESQMDDTEKSYQYMKHKKHEDICRHMVNQLVQMSMDICQYKETHVGQIPNSKISELKVLFIRGYPLETIQFPTMGSCEISRPTTGQETERFPLDRMIPIKSQYEGPEFEQLSLNDLELYLAGTEPWKFQKANLVANTSLEGIIEKLINTVPVSEPKNTMTKLVPSSIKIALLGKPFSGKTWLARQIADTCEVKLFDAVDIVNGYVEFAKTDPPSKSSYEQTKIEFGKKALNALNAGGQVDDQIMTSILVNEIKNCNNERRGFILVDYPKTRDQAAMLEKEISGYEEPKPVKAPPAKKGAPPKAPPPDPNLKSFLDFVFVLNVDNEIAQKRFASRRIDPATQRIYNLEFNPPAEDEIGVLQRLVAPDIPNDVNIQARNLLFDENIEPVKEWYTKLNSLQAIDANIEYEKVRSQIETIISDFTSGRGLNTVLYSETEMAERQKQKAITKAFYKLLQMWNLAEINFQDGLKKIFTTLRKDRDMIEMYFLSVKSNFGKFLERADKKQPLVDNFKNDFNILEPKAFTENASKTKLNVRIEDLREKLFEVCDQRRDFSEADRMAALNSKWLLERIASVSNAFIKMTQLELERYAQKCHIIHEYQLTLSDSHREPKLMSDIRRIQMVEKSEGCFFDELVKAKQAATLAAKEPPAKEHPKSAGGKKDPKANSKKPVEIVIEKPSEIVPFNAEEMVLNAINDADKLLDYYILNSQSESAVIEKKNFLVISQGLREIASTAIKRLKASGAETFVAIDEMIGAQYRAEIDAVKQLIQYIGERVETKSKMSPVVLDGKLMEVKKT